MIKEGVIMEKSGFVIVKKGENEVGLNDKDGKEILPCIYDRVLDYDKDGYVRFIKDKVYGTINLKGEICIPLSLGITHLGVFHKGTARARKGKLWGLVTPMGEKVISFAYKSIDSYSYPQKGYPARDMKGEKGWLSPDGSFVPGQHEHEHKPEPKPECMAVLSYYLFDSERFRYRLNDWTGYHTYPLHFYYRDTDAPIDAVKLYEKGMVIRNDRFLETTQKLQKPIHKTRFLIASRSLLHISKFQKSVTRQNKQCNTQNRTIENSPLPTEEITLSYKDVVIPPNTYFLVKDVKTYAGVTQVLLLHLPHEAISLAKRNGYNLSQIPAYVDGYEKLEKVALQNLQIKTGGIVHGFSLSEEWCRKMYWPIGLDEQFHLNSLDSVSVDNLIRI